MLIELHTYSQVLEIETTVQVLLPEPDILAGKGHKPVPTLYLLHGLSGDQGGWVRHTRILDYARKYYLAVVMPAVNRSFYVDMAHGARYFTYMSQELPAALEAVFPLATKREERFVAGLSMGGYGALRLGLGLPDRYGAAASLSGAVEIQQAYEGLRRKLPLPLQRRELDDMFGSEQALLAGDNNLWNLARALASTPEKAPKLYLSCGTEDSLLEASQHFMDDFGEAFSITYQTGRGGHTWDYWEGQIQQVLRWLPLEKLELVW